MKNSQIEHTGQQTDGQRDFLSSWSEQKIRIMNIKTKYLEHGDGGAGAKNVERLAETEARERHSRHPQQNIPDLK